MKKKAVSGLKVASQDFNELIKAIKEEDLDEVKYILSTTQDKISLLTSQDAKGQTPLHIAISKHINQIILKEGCCEACYETEVNVPLVQLLLEVAGEDADKLVSAVDEGGNTPFHLAAKIKYPSVPFFSAGLKDIKDMKLIETILDKSKIHPTIIVSTVDKEKNNPLHHALISGDSSEDIVKTFLERCGKYISNVFGKKNRNGDTNLHLAAYEAAPKSLKLMLDALDPEQAKHYLCKQNLDGKTPLHLASDNTFGLCCLDIVELIIDKAGDKAKELVLKTDKEGVNILHSLIRYMDLQEIYNDENVHKVIKLITELAGDDAVKLITQEDDGFDKPLLMALPVKKLVEHFMTYNPPTTPEELAKIQECLNSNEEIYYSSNSSDYSYETLSGNEEEDEDSSLSSNSYNDEAQATGVQSYTTYSSEHEI